MSLKTLLGLGATALGVGTWVTALILWLGLLAVSDRLEAAVKAEQRMSGYAGLSTQAATFLVVATEAVQTLLADAGFKTGLDSDRLARAAAFAHSLRSPR